MLAAEVLLLLSLGPDGRQVRAMASNEIVDVGVAGALVAELAVRGRVAAGGRGPLQVLGPETGDPLLDAALEACGRRALGRSLSQRLPGIARHAGRPRVLEHLMAQELVGHVKAGRLSATRHPPREDVHQRVLGRYRELVAGDGPPEPVDAIVIGLSGPCRLLEVVAPDRGGHLHARARMDEALELLPLLRQVRRAIEDLRSD
jgi:hypothetical protein